jgi:hypothetical protein
MKKKLLFIVALSICVIIGLVSAYLFFNSLFAKPLEPSLKNDLAGQPTSNFDQHPIPGQTSIPPLTEQPPLCGDTPVLTILVSGIDYEGDNYL